MADSSQPRRRLSAGQGHRVAAPVAVNPFATCHTRPGRIAYTLPSEWTWERASEKFSCQDYWGVIEGPHGVGKSTFLASFGKYLQRQHLQLWWIRPYTWQSDLQHWQATASDHRRIILVVDGFERLRRWSRRRLCRLSRRHQWGLLATAHQPLGLPLLIRLAPNLEQLINIVEQLQQDVDPLVTASDVRKVFQRNNGDARESLFSLYDLYEQRQRALPQGTQMSAC